MSHFVRASKYRNVFVDPPKPEQCFTLLPISSTSGEQSYIKGNTKYCSVAVQGGGGPFIVLSYDKPGRFERSNPLVTGHTGNVLDFEWNPFHEQVLATCSEDTTVKIWGIPVGGVTEPITEPLVDLPGHQRKVTLLRFHPTASNVLCSVGADTVMKVWDIESGLEAYTFEEHEQLIQDIVWDHTGANFATSSKDKKIRICDVRNNKVSQIINTAHEGARSTKLTYLGSKEKLLSVGFTRQSQRQFKIWDPRNLSQEIKRIDIDQAAGVILPFYDEDSQLLYLAGKGDGNIRYYEFVDENPWCFYINEFRSTSAAKGMAMVPKLGLDLMKCETARLLKLTSNAIEPLSFIVPRKSDAFQDDLFPPTYAGVPSLTASEWIAGEDKPPVLTELRPDSRPAAANHVLPTKKIGNAIAAPLPSVIADKVNHELEDQLQAAMDRILLLEKVIKENGLRVP
mmetsp:Transcript_959/g.1440  ORF Transcript_959/g.1440 Transcript_959/m.1440 type:complete len:454 (+) Transcript_959:132-1493(+)|eukprot:CAMPEP_0171461924 /NCGR_PEP_ID=MMETSP0945-20130129/6171_1 /TAXON_ID=109269 /ORGANISM="Vaucheria litorea, Strain CCMP2940" /LENGTH=453 /DNA_ID=CAMNT_0011988355 /DNA_START=132 /DNA_END=1493 /DNA_ORIENTATION=+